MALAGSAWAWTIWALATAVPARADEHFLVHPYLQLGESTAPDRMAVLWHADDVDAPWRLDARVIPERSDQDAATPLPTATVTYSRIDADGHAPHRVYKAEVAGLEPGRPFAYSVRLGEHAVFQATANARPDEGLPHRFVAFGDCASGSPEQRAIAHQAALARPDYAVITGDLVYMRGRVAEYRTNFFPAYNSPVLSGWTGAPLLRSVPFVGVPGNHDLWIRDLDAYPDALAYFYYWDQPRNGPVKAPDPARPGRNVAHPEGPEDRKERFFRGAGDRFPVMANFSFDAGDVHWTVLDGNPYMDWTDPALRDWLARDLAAAKEKPWRFVAYHQPAFHSSIAHASEQRMRLICDLLEAGKVSIVFAGHVHNYQRTYPLTFSRTGPMGADGRVPGDWTLDRSYDGVSNTTPRGILHLTTGAGGAKLYRSEEEERPSFWQPFTCKYVSDTHSLTVVDVTRRDVRIRQLDLRGREIDAFRVTR